jgi:hypothetical protein
LLIDQFASDDGVIKPRHLCKCVFIEDSYDATLRFLHECVHG